MSSLQQRQSARLTQAADLATALDPCRLFRRASLIEDPWQRQFLSSTATRSLLLCARQAGKSTVVAALACHTALYQPGSLILVISPSERQSLELFRKIRAFAGLTDTIDPKDATAHKIELDNGSRILALPGSAHTVRGYSAPRLILIDEAAFVDDTLWHAVSPMLSGGGRVVALTTPNGRVGWLYDAWTNGGDVWDRIKITAADIPHRITEEFLATERATKPDWVIQAEYFCAFVDTDMTLFGSDLIEQAITPSVRPLDVDLAW